MGERGQHGGESGRHLGVDVAGAGPQRQLALPRVRREQQRPKRLVRQLYSELHRSGATITDAFDNFGAQTGSLASGDTTDDQTPTLRGTAPANSVVMIRAQHASGEKTYSVKAGADGKWSWTPESALAKGDWDFQVKDAGAKNWGDPFELNIIKGYPIDAGIINFEDLSLNSNLIHPVYYNPKDGIGFFEFTSGPQNISKLGELVVTPGSAPDYFGEKTLKLVDEWRLHISRTDGRYEIEYAGLDLWNSSNQDVTLTVRFLGKNYDFTIKAGEVFTFDTRDFNIIEDVQSFFISSVYEKPSTGIYVDNAYMKLRPSRYSNYCENEPENIVHFLDGVDELTDHAITGSETQVDTLQFTGKDQLLDLSQHKAEIQSVEIFDIRGSGDNTLKIDLDALLHYGEKDLFIEDGKTQLMINGDAGDVVQLKDILPEGSDISEWQHQQGTVTVAGVEYEVYSHGDDAELLVQQGVKTELI